MLDLGTLGGSNSSAVGINNAGQVAGTAELSFRSETYLPSHAFRWTAPGVMQDLGPVVTPGRNESSSATGINNLGQVAGLHYFDIAASVFRWTPSGGMQDLGVGGHSVAATAINDLGEVAGSWEARRGCAFRAFRWTSSGGVQDLGTLGTGVCAGSHASAMNDRGQVAGSYSDDPFSDYPMTRAMRWTPLSGMQDLGTLGGINSSATAINARGQITGDANTPRGADHAFLWTPTKPPRCTSRDCPFATPDRR
jgi:probable HAF family extracellular repeat protein